MATLSLVAAGIQLIFALYLIQARPFREAPSFGLATLVAALANAGAVAVIRSEPGTQVFIAAALVYLFALATVVPLSLYAALSFLRRIGVPAWPARLMLLSTGAVVVYIAFLLRAGVWQILLEAEDANAVLTTVNSLFTVGREVIREFPTPTFGHVVTFMAVVTGIPLLWGIVNWYRGKGTPRDRSTASYILLTVLFMGLVTLPAQVWFRTSQLILLNAMLFTTAILFIVLDLRGQLVRRMLRRASVGQKLGWGFGSVIVVVLGLSLVSVLAFSTVNRQVQDVIITHHFMLKYSDEILSNVRAARAAEQTALAAVGRENLPAIMLGPLSRWRKHIAIAEQRLNALDALPLAEEDQKRVDLFFETLERYENDFELFSNTLVEVGDPSTGKWGDWVAANQRLEDLLRVSPATQGLLITFFEMQEAEYEFVITHQEVYLQNAQVRQAEFEAWFDAIEAQQLPENLREAIDQAIEDEQAAFSSFAEAVGTLDVTTRSLQANGATLQRLALQLSEVAEGRFQAGLDQAVAIQANGGLVVIGMTVLAFLVALFAVQAISTQLTDEALTLAEAARHLAAGELETRVRLETADELGLVGGAFNQMATRLQDLLQTLEERVARRTSHLETAALVSQEASALADLDQLLNHAVELIRRRFGFYHAQVFLLDEERKWAVLKASTGEAGRLLLARGHRLEVGSRSVIGKVTSEGTPVVARDTDKDPIHRKNELLPETRSELAVPMKLGGEIIGALDVQSTQPNAFDDDDIVALQILANQIAISIRNAELFKSLEETLYVTETLYTTGQRLFQVESEEALFVRMLQGLVGAGRHPFDLVGAMVVVFRDGDPRAGRVVADWYPDAGMPSLQGATLELNVDPGECREWCLTLEVDAQHRLRLTGSDGHKEHIVPLQEHLARIRAASSVMFPLHVGERLAGAVFLHSARVGAFESSRLVPFRVLVDEAGTVLHNRRLFERTETALEETRLLYQATSGFAQAESPEDVVAVALEAARALGFDAVHLAVLPEVLPADVDTVMAHEFRVYARAIHSDLRDVDFAFRLGDEARRYLQLLLAARESVFALEEGGKQALEMLVNTDLEVRFESLLSRPLMTRDQVTGILSFLSVEPRQFDERTKRIFLALSEQASASLETILLFEQLKTNLESTQALYNASAALAAAATVDDIAQAIAQHLLPSQDAFVAINELDVDQRGRVRGFTVVANYLPGGRPSPHVGRYFSVEEFPSVQRLLEPGYPPLVVEDIEADPRMTEADRVSYRRQRVRSMFSVAFPLGRGYGMLHISYRHPVHFSEADVQRWRTIVGQLGLVMENRRLLDQTRAALQETRRLYEITSTLVRSTTVEDVYAGLLKSVAVLEPHWASIWMFDEPVSLDEYPPAVRLVRAVGELSAPVPEGAHIAAEHFPLVVRLSPDRPLVASGEEPVAGLLPPEFLRALSAQSLAVYAFRTATHWVGFTLLTWQTPRTFSEADMRAVETGVSQATVVLENLRLFRQAQEALARTQRLYRASHLLSTAVNAQDVANAMFEAGEAFWTSASVWLFPEPVMGDEELPDVVINAAVASLELPTVEPGAEVPWRQVFPEAHVLGKGPYILFEDVREAPLAEQTKAMLEQMEARRLLIVPLRTVERWLGWLVMRSGEPGPVPKVEIEIYRTLADQATIVLDNLRLFETAQMRAWREEMLNRIAARLHRSVDPNSILQAGVSELRQVLHARRAGVWVVPPQQWGMERRDDGNGRGGDGRTPLGGPLSRDGESD